MRYHVGTSGWQYPHWKGVFYPPEVRLAGRLAYYSGRLPTLELNVTFYRQVSDAVFRKWHDSTPSGFLFSLKMSRFVTHIKRLKPDEGSVARFLAGASQLGEKLGVVLVQLPPSLTYDKTLVEEFFGRLDPSFRYAVEARNSTFLCDAFLNLLRELSIAWCVADSDGRFPYLEEATADFVYVRLHGSEKLYASEYSEGELLAWRDRILAWDREAFVYFDNDFAGFAAKNALTLQSMLGG